VGSGDPWLVIQHVTFEGPGSIALALSDAGADLTLVRVDRADAIPPPAAVADLAGLVVMGGPMSVADDLQWLADERALLREAVGAGRPVLGVCLGAQQLAAALGAPVTPGPAPEYGVGEVHLTAAAIDDPVFGPAPSPLPCVHWHGDTFGLPEGAVRLAGNDASSATGGPTSHPASTCAPPMWPTSAAPATASCGASSPWRVTG
jgi:GMP synthase (glutamine-hydrolysing)